MKKRIKLTILAILLMPVALTVAHRLWLQLRPLPTNILYQRPMTNTEWDKLKCPAPFSTNFLMIDSFPYPDHGRTITLSPADFRTIRALASWGSFMPYRVTSIGIWDSTNVSAGVYELYTSELRFTKDSSGWHMKPIGGHIDWVSEKAKPTLSFH